MRPPLGDNVLLGVIHVEVSENSTALKYIAHEVNAETERLIRQHQIDYLLTQDLDQPVLQLGEVLLEVKAAGGVTNLSKLLPIRVFTPFHFG